MREHWRAALLVAAMLALWVFAGISLALHGGGPGFDSPPSRAGLPTPATERLRRQAEAMSATQLKQIAPVDAIAWNAAFPVSNAANPAAQPFRLGSSSEADRARSLDCLTAAIYYEAALEPLDGQRAVAQVILNRVRHPAYPATVCGVVFEGSRRITGCQFTLQLRRLAAARHRWRAYWQRAREVAEDGAQRLRLFAGRLGDPLSRQLRGALLGLEPGQVGHDRQPYLLPLARRLGPSARLPQPLCRGRAGDRLARRLRPAEHGRAAAAASARDAAAAAAAAKASLPIGSVDSFQRAVLRRYEPLRRDTANAMISERARADTSLSNSQRWALTGRDDRAETPQQRPLGRWGTVPAESPPPPPPPRPQASGNNASTSGTDSSASGSDASASGTDASTTGAEGGMTSGQ